MENAFIAALLSVPGIGQERVKLLMRCFGSARKAWYAEQSDLFKSACLPSTVLTALLNKRTQVEPIQLLQQWRLQGIEVVSIDQPLYPSMLRAIYHPPLLLFYQGTLPLDDQLIAIVGSRQATAYGKNAAKSLATGLSAAGFWVVSGGARGIDTAAHWGALAQGKTVAVLGCGIDIVYPRENGRLFKQIVESGAIISEYPPGVEPNRGLFPRRNQLISGISRGVVVVEAASKSGALITADAALEQNRDVFAVPGSIFSEQSKGAHQLIKQGAKMVDCVNDVLEEYQISGLSSSRLRSLSAEETLVYKTLSLESALSLEEIVAQTNLAASLVSYILLQFELEGIASAEGQRYLRAWEGTS